MTIENVLEEDEIIQDLKTNQNSQFLYMISNESIRKLIDYATKMPASDDQKVGHKYPFNAAELLSCDNNGFMERFMNEINIADDSDEEEKEGEKKEDEQKKDENEEFVEVKEEEKKEEGEKKNEQETTKNEGETKEGETKEGETKTEEAKDEKKNEENQKTVEDELKKNKLKDENELAKKDIEAK